VASDVEFTDEFGGWWHGLTDSEKESISAIVEVLESRGPQLGRPHVDSIHSSKRANMKELRIQHEGRPFRILFAFDPRRTALLLIGGDKSGNSRWYEEFVPKADKIYSQHLKEIKGK
jgi:hypothetical protein